MRPFNYETMSDSELYQRYLTRDHEAFGYLFIRHFPELFNLAGTILKNDPLADEAVWKVYGKFHTQSFFKNSTRFEINNPKAIRSYLRKAVERKSLDLATKSSFQRRRVSPETFAYQVREEIRGTHHPTPLLYDWEWRKLYKQIITRLGPGTHQAKVFKWRLRGVKPKEIVALLGRSQHNVNNDWYRAKRIAIDEYSRFMED